MPDFEILKQELTFKAVRSSGAGGQHVNKTSSKVVVTYDITSSAALVEEERSQLLNKLSSRLTSEGVLIMDCSESRSQHTNKELVVDKLLEVIIQGLKKKKPRKKTTPSRASKLKRLKEKKAVAEKKANRQPPDL